MNRCLLGGPVRDRGIFRRCGKIQRPAERQLRAEAAASVEFGLITGRLARPIPMSNGIAPASHWHSEMTQGFPVIRTELT